MLQVGGSGLAARDGDGDAATDEHRRVGHHAHDAGLTPQPGLQTAEREAGSDRYEELPGVGFGTNVVQDGSHHLRLDGEDDRLRLPHQLPVVSGGLDLVEPATAPELRVHRIARPEVLCLVVTAAQQALQQRRGHVPGSDEADLFHEPCPPAEEPGRQAPGPRAPKSARPSRSQVAPSSTATVKSSLIPIERWGSSTPSPLAVWSRTSRRSRKYGLLASGTAAGGGTAISPSRPQPGRQRTVCASPRTSSGGTPRLVGSAPRFTWMRTGRRRRGSSSTAARAAARTSESRL